MGAGDTLIDGMIEQAIRAVENGRDEKGVCKSHEPIRVGLHALLLAEQDRRKASSFFRQVGAVHATGWSTSIAGVVYLILKAHGIDLVP